jgi:glycosyltransferase involved in cell wall biosynthesis
MRPSRKALNSPILSLCIPAFNDAAELQKTLVSIERLVGRQNLSTVRKIEVVISDNCSSDSTGDLIEGFNCPGLAIRKLRQTTNIGFRANIEKLAFESRGEWLLFVSCGDVLLSNFDYEALFSRLNLTPCITAFYSFDMTDQASGVTFSGGMPLNNFLSEQSAILYSAAPMPFFKTKSLKATIKTCPPETGNWWPQIEWALTASQFSGTSAYIGAGPLTGNRPVSGWWSKPLAYGSVIELAKLLRSRSKGHMAGKKLMQDQRQIVRTLPAWVFQTRIVFANSATLDDFSLLLRNIKVAPGMVALSLAVLVCPAFLLVWLRRIAQRIKR